MHRAHIKLIFVLAGATTVFAVGFGGTRNQVPLRFEPRQQPASATSQDQASHSTATLELPITFERRVGDLDGMLKKHEIRALVVPSRSGFSTTKAIRRESTLKHWTSFNDS